MINRERVEELAKAIYARMAPVHCEREILAEAARQSLIAAEIFFEECADHRAIENAL